MAEEVLCYVAKKSCGCVVGAIVATDNNPARVAAALAMWAREGLRIEPATVEQVRQTLWTCPHEPRQMALSL